MEGLGAADTYALVSSSGLSSRYRRIYLDEAKYRPADQGSTPDLVFFPQTSVNNYFFQTRPCHACLFSQSPRLPTVMSPACQNLPRVRSIPARPHRRPSRLPLTAPFNPGPNYGLPAVGIYSSSKSPDDIFKKISEHGPLGIGKDRFKARGRWHGV